MSETDGLIRFARADDLPEIWAMVCELADYERSLEQVAMTEEQLGDVLFGNASRIGSGHPSAWCHVVEAPGSAGQRLGGFALWFLNFSTWTGSHGIYLEDLYVRPRLRGRGHGKALLAELASLAVARGYARVEWWVLDWNTPSIDFYRSIGAVGMDEWTVQRLTGPALESLADTARRHGPDSVR